MAYHLDIDVATLYNWRKNKPNLYRIVMLGFKFDELIEKSKQQYEDLTSIDESIRLEIKDKAKK
nr:transcriptional regulator [Campylobacter mucosalis]